MTGRVPRAALALGLGAALVIGLAQLLLPAIAERSVRTDLEEVGQVRSVEIRALPAVKLLAGRADSVRVEMASYRSGPGRLGELLARTDRVGELDVRVAELRVPVLTLRDATLDKTGQTLRAAATLRLDDLQRALPPGVSVTPVDQADGDGLLFEGRLRAFGLTGSARARVRATGGRIVISPDVPLGSLVGIAVFDEDRLHVEELRLERRPGSFTVEASGMVVG